MSKEKIAKQIKDTLWQEADRLNWSSLPSAEKSKFYEIWTKDPSIGGKLAAFMDPRKVRVYIKDTLLKPYTREKMADHQKVLNLLGLPSNSRFKEVFIKPHGRILSDGKVVAWSKATEWKLTVLAVYERAFLNPALEPYGVVFFESASKFSDSTSREVVETAATKLGIKKVIWLD